MYDPEVTTEDDEDEELSYFLDEVDGAPVSFQKYITRFKEKFGPAKRSKAKRKKEVDILCEPSPKPAVDEFEYDFYNPHRGMAIIINNERFSQKAGMGKREGSRKDASALEKMFKHLGFHVKRYDNLTAKQMVLKLQAAASNAKYDHGLADCFACAILSHGREATFPPRRQKGVPVYPQDVYGVDCPMIRHDVVFGVDGTIVPTRYLLSIFSDECCPELEGKPRLFFIQACRGGNMDSGTTVTKLPNTTVSESKRASKNEFQVVDKSTEQQEKHQQESDKEENPSVPNQTQRKMIEQKQSAKQTETPFRQDQTQKKTTDKRLTIRETDRSIAQDQTQGKMTDMGQIMETWDKPFEQHETQEKTNEQGKIREQEEKSFQQDNTEEKSIEQRQATVEKEYPTGQDQTQTDTIENIQSTAGEENSTQQDQTQMETIDKIQTAEGEVKPIGQDQTQVETTETIQTAEGKENLTRPDQTQVETTEKIQATEERGNPTGHDQTQVETTEKIQTTEDQENPTGKKPTQMKTTEVSLTGQDVKSIALDRTQETTVRKEHATEKEENPTVQEHTHNTAIEERHTDEEKDDLCAHGETQKKSSEQEHVGKEEGKLCGQNQTQKVTPNEKKHKIGDGSRKHTNRPSQGGNGTGRSAISVSPSPIYKDFLLMYAAPPGHFSWRRVSGGWMIQSLKKVLMSDAVTKVSLTKLLTKVCLLVAMEYESISSMDEFNKKKNVPCIMSMLTKDVFFRNRDK